MGKPVRRRLSPEARKLEIIEAAERLLQARGEHVRVEDVVREAGVAKGTFFLYFPTWDDLLEAIRLLHRVIRDNGVEVLVPAVRAFVRAVEEDRVVLDPPPGLLELNR